MLCFPQAALEGKGAEVMQAVPNMLELVPRGVNKWVGLQVHYLLSPLPEVTLSPFRKHARSTECS